MPGSLLKFVSYINRFSFADGLYVLLPVLCHDNWPRSTSLLEMVSPGELCSSQDGSSVCP